MQTIQLAISGLPAGGMYALAALGIVLIYRTTGTLNFSQGAIATASAFTFHWAFVEQGTPLVVAVVIALAQSVVMGLLLERLMRAIGTGNVLAQLIATLGVQGLVLYGCDELFGKETRLVPTYFPEGGWRISDVFISYDQLAVVGIAGLLAILLGLALRTGRGTCVRAVSQNRTAANLAGLPVARLQALSWATGSALAGLAGVLLAPLLFVDSVRLNVFFLVKPFAAAVVGGLSSLSVAFFAGLGIGAAEGVLTRFNVLPGLTETVPFAMILVALLVRRRFRLESAQASLSSAPAVRPGTGRLWPGVLVFAGAAAIVPSLDSSDAITFRLAVAFSLLALSVVVLTGWVGQVSLAQGAFFGLGAFMAATFGNRMDLPFALVLILAPLSVVPFALAIGLPAVRFRGMLLAVVTLAFGALCSTSLFQWRTFTGGLDGSHLPSPSLFGYDLGTGHRFELFALALAGLVFLGVRNVARFRAGGSFFGVRESEEGAAALGMGVTATKLVAFGVSGAIAGLGGCLFGYSLGFVSGEQFTPFLSFTVFAVAVVAGSESLWGAALAGVIYAVPSGPTIQLLSSVSLVVILLFLPGGLVQLPRKLGRLPQSRRSTPKADSVAPPDAASRAASPSPEARPAEVHS